MSRWPDPDFRLIASYVSGLPYRGPKSRRPCASVLRRFQRFLLRDGDQPLSQATITAWLREEVMVSPRSVVIRRAQIVDTFLDWLVAGGHLEVNSFAILRAACTPRGVRSIVPALLDSDPVAALARLRSPRPFASHLGQVMQQHIERMRTLGYRYREEGRLRRFDRFLQERPDAERESLSALVNEYASHARSPAVCYERLRVGRLVAGALQRLERPGAAPAHDPLLKRAVQRQYRRPYIFSSEEIAALLRTARGFPSPHAPLRPATLYTMIVLGYCAGLRIGEIVRLRLSEVDLTAQTLEIHQTKFFKSRRVPIRPSVAVVIAGYLVDRAEAGLPTDAAAPLFCHEKGGYVYLTAEHLLRRVIRSAGLKPDPGRRGPRVHDLRHTFVVHRMLAWYRQGINPQGKLPYLSTYLGHRDIHSTLVYLTITQELLGMANERFRVLGASQLATFEGATHGHDSVPSASSASVLSRLAGPAAGRFGPHRPRLPRHLAPVPPLRRASPPPRGGRPRVR